MDTRSTACSPSGDNTCPVIIQRLPPFPAIPRRRQSLARCQELENNAPQFQVSSKKIRTFSHHQENFRHHLCPETPTTMEDPPSIPCVTLDAVQRNLDAWRKLHRTSPKSDRSRTRVGSGADLRYKTLQKSASVPDQMERLFRRPQQLGTRKEP